MRSTLDRTDSGTRARRVQPRRQPLERQLAALVLNFLIAAVVLGAGAIVRIAGAAAPSGDPPVLAMKLFALWTLSFLPCWLYVRFLGQRAGALWDEYVLNLHRLGWDQPRFLPRPVPSSQYHHEWLDDGGPQVDDRRSIYRQKFDAYYGRAVAENAREGDFRVRLDTMFPVLMTATVLAVCWTAVLWDDRYLQGPADIGDVLKFGFVGAYVFTVQMLLRRFFASDLRPSAYTSALVRITVVLLSVAALCQVLQIWLAGEPHARSWEAAAAFVVGFFPLVAAQVLVHAVSSPLRTPSSKLESDYPLSQLDGLSIWYEARLVEENVEDMQNLATANFVDVMLHTRVPVGRLVDWVDQAYLFLHLDRVERGVSEIRRARRGSGGTFVNKRLVGCSVQPGSRGGTRTRTVLRQIGIRTATDLIKAFPPERFDPSSAARAPEPQSHQVERILTDAGLDCGQVRMLVRVLSEEKGLAPVWNWHDRGVRAHCAQRRPRSMAEEMVDTPM